MNKDTRKQLSVLIDELTSLQARVQELGEAEREKYDNMSEGLQCIERGQAISTAADTLEDQASELTNIIDNLNELIL